MSTNQKGRFKQYANSQRQEKLSITVEKRWGNVSWLVPSLHTLSYYSESDDLLLLSYLISQQNAILIWDFWSKTSTSHKLSLCRSLYSNGFFLRIHNHINNTIDLIVECQLWLNFKYILFRKRIYYFTTELIENYK